MVVVVQEALLVCSQGGKVLDEKHRAACSSLVSQLVEAGHMEEKYSHINPLPSLAMFFFAE